jgi:hypothetical protein
VLAVSHQGFLVVVTGKLAPGHLSKFIDLYKPLVSGQGGMQGDAVLCVGMVCLTDML